MPLHQTYPSKTTSAYRRVFADVVAKEVGTRAHQQTRSTKIAPHQKKAIKGQAYGSIQTDDLCEHLRRKSTEKLQ